MIEYGIKATNFFFTNLRMVTYLSSQKVTLVSINNKAWIRRTYSLLSTKTDEKYEDYFQAKYTMMDFTNKNAVLISELITMNNHKKRFRESPA